MGAVDPNGAGPLVIPSGLPSGGTNGQVLSKVAGVAAWADAASGLPTASGADQFPASTGAGTTYTARTAAQVRAALGGGDTPLAVGAVKHLWRCTEASSPFADTGSAPANLAVVVNNSRTYARAGLQRSFGATRGVASNSPSNAHMAASITAFATNASVTFGVTVASPTGSINPDLASGGNDRVIARLWNTGGSYSGIWLTVIDGTTDLCARFFHAGGTGVTQIAVDWTRPHRIEATVDAVSKVSTLYVDGAAVWTHTSGSVAWSVALDKVELGGASSGLGEPCRCSNLLMADLVVDDTASSAADVLARAEAVRRLA